MPLQITGSGLAERIPRKEFNPRELEPGWVVLSMTNEWVYIGTCGHCRGRGQVQGIGEPRGYMIACPVCAE